MELGSLVSISVSSCPIYVSPRSHAVLDVFGSVEHWLAVVFAASPFVAVRVPADRGGFEPVEHGNLGDGQVLHVGIRSKSPRQPQGQPSISFRLMSFRALASTTFGGMWG